MKEVRLFLLLDRHRFFDTQFIGAAGATTFFDFPPARRPHRLLRPFPAQLSRRMRLAGGRAGCGSSKNGRSPTVVMTSEKHRLAWDHKLFGKKICSPRVQSVQIGFGKAGG